jgi:hypothetical protein
MKTRHNSKTFNENLNPLLGYLRTSVGRPWDKVYSEICEVFDTRKVINRHILVHLAEFVMLDVKMIDGVVCRLRTGWRSYNTTSYDDRWEPLVNWTRSQTYPLYYRHPVDGLLKVQKGETYRQAKKREAAKELERLREHYIRVDDRTELVKLHGVWYRAVAAKLPPPVVVYEMPHTWRTPEQWALWKTLTAVEREEQGRKTLHQPMPNKVDVHSLHYATRESHDRYYRGLLRYYDSKTHYYVQKSQLTKSELKKHKLSNDANDESTLSHRQLARHRK